MQNFFIDLAKNPTKGVFGYQESISSIPEARKDFLDVMYHVWYTVIVCHLRKFSNYKLGVLFLY